MSPNASHRVRPGLSSAASLMTTLQISFDQEVLNQHLNLVTPEYPFFESPCGLTGVLFTADALHCQKGGSCERLQPATPCWSASSATSPPFMMRWPPFVS